VTIGLSVTGLDVNGFDWITGCWAWCLVLGVCCSVSRCCYGNVVHKTVDVDVHKWSASQLGKEGRDCRLSCLVGIFCACVLCVESRVYEDMRVCVYAVWDLYCLLRVFV
jgi:hypothetical protein